MNRTNLGNALKDQGKLDEAVAEYHRAAELAPPGSPLARAIPGLIRHIEPQIALARRLAAVLDGKDKPGNPAEGVAFAQLCCDTQRHAAAARLWAEALAADPKLGNDREAQHRYNAACAAALAAAGAGKDDTPPDDAAKTRLRGQALDWLKAELAAWSKLLESGPPQARPAIAQTLKHWQEDLDLASIRNPQCPRQAPRSRARDMAVALGKRRRPAAPGQRTGPVNGPPRWRSSPRSAICSTPSGCDWQKKNGAGSVRIPGGVPTRGSLTQCARRSTLGWRPGSRR